METDKTIWTERLLDSPHEAADKGSRIRRMFNAIAPRYEFINTVFSAGRDTAWRRKAVKLAKTTPTDAVLDIACGTGDFARAFSAQGARTVVGCDFAHDMLTLASKRSGERSLWSEADALQLPFHPESFSITSCAFGVRNFHELDIGLREMHRVLLPGGRAVIIEFTRPSNRVARALYELYSTRFMPMAATLISGDKSGAYRYLPSSVVTFLNAEQMCERLRRAGFAQVVATPMTLGIVTVYVATKD